MKVEPISDAVTRPPTIFLIAFIFGFSSEERFDWSEVYGATAVSVNDIFSHKLRVSKSKALSPWLKNLGDNIRRERMAQGMTQQQLAEFADLNIRNVQRIEAGEIDVLLTTVVRIRKAIGCPLYQLLPKD